MNAKQQILFVCLGNIVRSPLAEALFRKYAREAGLEDQVTADSAAIGKWHVGEGPDERMLQVALRHGLRYEHRARQVQRSDLDRFDWIIAMDGQNKAALLKQARTPEQRQKIRLLRSYDPLGGPAAAVPDPYYGGVDGFEEVYAIVDRSVCAFLDELQHTQMKTDP
jgi:protein-tyrosine phosphatase